MGSLYSKPKVPAISYTPVTATAPAAADTPATSTDGSATDAAKAEAAVRKRSLPETILTSFRGVLTQGDWVPQRKSLLGE
jgi:hypothetical protein